MSSKENKLSFYLYFIALGLISSILQMIFLREVLTSFRGNELFLNYFLISWLILVGLGSLISSQNLRAQTLSKFVGFYYFIVGALAITVLLIIRSLPWMLGFTNEIPNLSYSLIILPLTILPVSLLLGIGFSWGSKYFNEFIEKTTALNVNRAYLIETFGFFAGALAFNFWLVKFSALNLILVVFIFGLMVSSLILIYRKRSWLSVLSILLNLFLIIIVGYFIVTGANNYEIKTVGWRFLNEKLIKSSNSFFGNIAITEKQGQHNFYEQGSLIAPAQDFQTAEELIHLPLLFVEKPQKILIIGNGWNGFIQEALKYPSLEIFYAELDPELIPIIYQFLTPEQQKDLKDRRVKIISQDAFSYLKQKGQEFDSILSNLPTPTTYQTNRYYTKEFFALAKQNLTQNGVLTLTLPYYPENLKNSNINRFIASILSSFNQIFQKRTIAPSQKLILLGFKNENLNLAVDMALENFKQRDIETRFLSASYIEYLLTNERTQQVLSEIKKIAAIPNTNWLPSAVIYQTISQIEISQPKFTYFLNWLLSWRWFGFGLLIIGSFWLIYWLKAKTKTNWPLTKIKLIAVFASSLSLILEIILIFVWQVTIGYVYHQISLIIGLVMMGIFLANWQLYQKLPNDKSKALKWYLGGLLFLAIVLTAFVITLNYYQLLMIKIIILFLSLVAGYLAGAIYPLANYLYLSPHHNEHQFHLSSRSKMLIWCGDEQKIPAPEKETGKIYGLELVGGGLLLIIFSLFILPFLGLIVFAGFLIYWIGLSYWLITTLPQKSER